MLSAPIVILLLIVPLLGVTSWSTHLTLKHGANVDQLFREIQFERSRLGVLMINDETGMRGYAITGDRSFLQPYMASEPLWDSTVLTLRRELQTVKIAPAELDALDAVHHRWLVTIAQPIIADRHRPDALTLEYRGKALVDKFRQDQNAFRLVTTGAARTADDDLLHSIDLTLALGATATVLVLLTGMVLAHLQTRAAQRLTEMHMLYENEKRIADQLQEAFSFKRLPSPPGMTLNATYVPSSNEAKVGGDWYDAFELPDGRVVFSIGDVTGHGMAAAVIMSRARQAIIAAALSERDPGSVLAVANATIHLQEQVMVTAICGFIEPDTMATSYATAGHPPPIIVRGTAASYLPAGGLALGVIPSESYDTFEAGVTPGDMLVLYTDGLIEHQRDILGGLDRLLSLVTVASTQPAPAVELYDAVFDSGSPSDDVAVLTVSFTPVAAADEPAYLRRAALP